MQNGKPELIALLREEIAKQGAIPFLRYMELCLFHPLWGYYGSGTARIGRKGDFFTNVSVGPLYGRLLAGQILELHGMMGEPELFEIVEHGAADGQLAADILAAIGKEAPDRLGCFRYRIVEPFDVWRNRQRETLEQGGLLDKVVWVKGTEELATIPAGFFLSNEYLDAFPVHLVEYAGGKWHEMYVGWAGGKFEFVRGEPSDTVLLSACKGIPELEGYRTELRIGLAGWMAACSDALQRGIWFTMDYGYEAADFFHPMRTTGTLMCYANHQREDNPLLQPGLCDLTAHIDYTALKEAGSKAGFEPLGLLDQHHFVVGAAGKLMLEMERRVNAGERMERSELRALQTLMHPEHLGTRFQCLWLHKGCEEVRRLSGLAHARA